MPEPLVSPSDVESALVRPLTSTEQNYIYDLAEQASAKLRTARRGIDVQIAAYIADPADPAGTDPEAVSSMLAGVVKRVLVNTRGLWSTTQATGPYSASETYPGARGGTGASDSPGALVITAADLAQLDGISFSLPSTIRTRPWSRPCPR